MIVEVCPGCNGSGLSQCPLFFKCFPKHKCNYNVLAVNHKDYEVCHTCKGEGRPINLIPERLPLQYQC